MTPVPRKQVGKETRKGLCDFYSTVMAYTITNENLSIVAHHFLSSKSVTNLSLRFMVTLMSGSVEVFLEA